MLILQGVSYTHPDKDILFNNIDLAINRQDRIALIGNNGSGKSTLLRIMAGVLSASAGTVSASAAPYYVPQHFGQYNELTIAQALRVDKKLVALNAILEGDVTETNLELLGDDWSIEEKCQEALTRWELKEQDLDTPLTALSGGQKTKLFLAGIMIHKPEIVLLDEPSNHLDVAGREILYNYIRTTTSTLVVVSHDRTLLDLLSTVYELSREGITAYGGNYSFYKEQKEIEANAFNEDLKTKEKELRKAKQVKQETMERQQKLDARGRKKQEKAGLPTISMNTLRNNAEKSTARAKDVHAGKVEAVSGELAALRKEIPDKDKMKIGLDDSFLHKGKVLIMAQDVNFSYGGECLWQQPLSFSIVSGARVAVKGRNGSGKTTLVKLLLGELQPQSGTITRTELNAIYIDQDYSLVNNNHTVYEQAKSFNSGLLEEHEIKSRLTHFLFTKNYWDKPCNTLSGGEKMRLMLCCLTISRQAPDIIILDEPTNNLDIQNVEILTTAIREYSGTVIVISHDAYFLEQVEISGEIICKGNYTV